MSKIRAYHFVATALVVLFTAMFPGAAGLYGQSTSAPVALDNPPLEETLVVPKAAKQVITVGGPQADISGYTTEAVQIAVDALKSRGGGIVRLGPGTYQIAAPIRLASGVSLIGAGKDTILCKVDGYSSEFVIDAGYGMLKLTVRDASGFRVGMGVVVYDDNHNGWGLTTAKITAIEDNVLYIDNHLVSDYRSDRGGAVSNNCSLVEAIDVEDVHIADFVVDGNKAKNEPQLNGCRGGGIYLHKARRCLVEGVEVKNFNGDGISWQVDKNITVRNCRVHHCTSLGFHPGTGSDKTTVEGCTSYNNGDDGIFLCWRVRNGTFRNNTVYGNDRYGFSIGHKDTDNTFLNNHVYENAKHGIYFRNENEQNAGHRNTFYNNVVENNGTGQGGGYGFYIDGITEDIVIENNTIRDTGKAFQKGGVYIGKRASNIKVSKNKMAGHKQGDVVDDSGK